MKNGVKITLIASIAIVLAVGSFLVWRSVSNKQNESAFAWPVSFDDNRHINISRVFGVSLNQISLENDFHTGIDIDAKKGDKVFASNDGIVEKAEWYAGYGQCVIIKHSKGLESLYGHLDKINVNKDQLVKKGDIIGLVGSTGNTIADNLHFEVRDISKDGKNHDNMVDPEAILPKLANIDHIQPKPASLPEYVWPYDKMPYGKVDIISHFGNKMDEIQKIPVFHTGVDIRLPEDTKIEAIKSGTVTKAEWNGGYGLFVEIDHGNGIKSRYGHMSKLLVKKDDRVDMGQAIGLCGNTGISLEPHLHFEIMMGKDYIDPIVFLNLKIK